MAQTGYTPILIYSSSTGGNAPAAGNLTNSTLGSELAINITDGKLFYKDNANAIQVIGWKTTPTTAGGTGLTSYTAGDLLYYASGTTLSKLAIGTSGQWLGSSGTAPQWNSPAALTKTDDTNVTLTLGGSASTALLNAASLTLGWTGQLAASRGGTGIGTYTAGDLLYASGTTTLSKLAIGTANYVLTSSGSAPQWTAGSSVSVGTASNLKSNATTGVMQIVGPAASSTRVMTIPDADFTVARTDAAQTFTGQQTITGTVRSTYAGQAFLANGATTGANFASVSNTGGSLDIGVEGATPSGYWVGSSAYAVVVFSANATPIQFISGYNNVPFTITSTDVQVKNNVVMSTAGKGINFTANSAAAGMTSQLLNWYEEGTWTPNQGSGLTVVGAFTSVGRYTRTGNVVVVNFSFSGATSVAINAGGNLCTNLPYTSNANLSYSGVMTRAGLASGGTCAVEANTKNAWATSTIAATGTLFCSVTYIV